MKQAFLARLTTALLVVACAAVHAQGINADDFAKHAEISDAALSPTGEYVAMAIPTANGTETQLQIVHLDGSGKTQVLRFGKQQHVTGLAWTADDQITVARAKMEPLKAAPYSLGELMSSDITGKRQETLFAYIEDEGSKRGRRKDNGFADLVKVLDNEPGKALVSYWCWDCGEEPDAVIFKVDTITGDRKEVERVKGPAGFIFDQNGVARILIAWDDNDDPKLSYRASPTSTWQPMPKSMAGYSLGGGRFDTDNNTLYATVSDAGEPEQLYKFDLAAGTRSKVIGRDDVEIAYMLHAGRNGVPFGVVYNAAKPSIQYLDPKSEWAQLHAALLKQFAGEMVNFVNFTRDNRKLLFTTTSDRHPGAYYLFDRGSKKIQLVNEWMSWIKPDQLAPMRPVEFASRDGQKMYGFYTAKGAGPKPLIVMPHGGPHGPYDSWGYDSDVQFLADRGYAVLQVNFRGSGGRGHNFMKSGYREWGGKMMDDIADGVRWAIDNKLADPNRICTYGASYGGYASLMQQIRYPELYKCAIGYVGVYDLNVMHKAGDIKSSRSGRRYLERVLGKDEAMLAANSPARHVGKIKVPVFLVQGADDRRVPMDQFNALKKAFGNAGVPIETMVANGEGHGFYKPENRAELYRRIEAFLGKHIGPGVQ